MARKVVAVLPARELARRRVLFDGLEQAFPVRFEGRDATGLRGLDAAVLIDAGREAESAVAQAGVRRLVALGSELDPVGGAVPFDLSPHAPLDRRLRGQRLLDSAARHVRPVPIERGDAVMASQAGAPAWVARHQGARACDTVAFAPAELAPDETLRGRLQEGRALALLPLVHMIRELTADLAFRPPPLRAAFVIDDPNLHWTSYGHLRYPQLVRHAEEHDYHVAMAMVPLDGRIAHRGAARLFRERADRISLLMHGNNHVREELMRHRPERSRQALLAQALRRVHAFERRTGVPVARVMTAPHGGCSEEMVRDMLLLGYDGLCIARPYPWAARPPASWLAGPASASPLAAFGPATLVLGGLPVLLRRPLDLSSADLALRAFLDQPLLIYGHHQDVADGLDPLAAWAERVRALGTARWASLAEIARTNFATRREGEVLRVRMYARRASVDLPPGVERVCVELPPGLDCDGAERVLCGPARNAIPGEEVPLPRGADRIQVALVRNDALDASAIPAPGWSPWPLTRRVAGESRDRIRPFYRRRKSARTVSVRFPAPSTARARRR